MPTDFAEIKSTETGSDKYFPFQMKHTLPLITKWSNLFWGRIYTKSQYSKIHIQISMYLIKKKCRDGILLPKLFWPTVRKKFGSDREKPLKFEAEGENFQIFWDHKNNLFKQWKARTIFSNRMLFFTCSWTFRKSNKS